MKIMLDPVEYKSKPTKNEIGIINNRIIKHPVSIEPEQLANEIITGKSFVPAYLEKKNGIIKRQAKYWTNQELVCLDFDEGLSLKEGLELFKNSAMFIYTTLSHSDSQHKFRVVMRTNELMTNPSDYESTYDYWLNKYPMCDSQCKDISRIFFGGKDLYVINYNNRIDINYNKNNKQFIKEHNVSSINGLHDGLRYPNIYNNLVGVPKRVDLIKEGDIDKLREVLNVEPKVFYTRTEAVEYINNVDMSELLGIDNPKKFSCIFHDDENPSANIFKKVDDKDKSSVYIYKCFSRCCNFKVGTTRKLIEHIRGCNKTEAFDFLLKVYNISIEETEDQKEQRAEIQKNIELLMDGTLKNDHEVLYERIRPYIRDLIVLHTIAKENIPPKHYTEEQVEFLIYCSMRHLASIIGVKDHKRIMKTVSLFVYLGLIFRKDKTDLPSEFIENVKKVIGEETTKTISFFGIPKYEESKHFEFGEQKAIEFKDNNMNMKSFGYEMLLRTVGFEEASRVYPKRKQKNLNKQQSDLSSIFEKVVMHQIQEKGWTTVKIIKEDVEATEGFKESKLKMIVGEIINKYDLETIQLNKKIKDKYNIDINGYPKIICQRGSIN